MSSTRIDLDPTTNGYTPATRRNGAAPEEPPHWRDFAACINQDLNLFFPISAVGAAAERQVEAAKQVCRSCPVQAQCLDWALDVGPEFGIFGGCTEVERRRLRSRRDLAQRWRNVPAPGPHLSEQSVAEALEPR